MKRVTSVDVAQLAGVSVAAVSRAYTPGASISKATRELVVNAAKQLGYQPNRLARSLNQRSYRLVGLLMSGWNNFGYVEILRMISERLEAEGYEVILKSVLESDRIEDYIDQVLQYQVAAIAVVSESLPVDIVAQCARRDVPVVLVNRVGRNSGCSAVSIDGVHLGNRIADFLIQRGHRRIALLRGRADIDFTEDAMQAITAAAAAAQDCRTTANLSGILGYAAGRRAINELLSGNDPPDAVFCTADDTAIGVLDGARVDRGIRVPEDLSVIGNGNRAIASWASHELTSADYPQERVIDACIKTLLERLENPGLKPVTTLLKTDLIVRASSRVMDNS